MVCSDYFVVDNMVHMDTDNYSNNTQHVLMSLQNSKQVRKCLNAKETL